MSMDLIGKRLGKYRLERLIGKGGMGEVYLAEHEMLQSRVAVKVLPADLARDESMVQRFLREARSAARLRHPHIIRIHDVDQDQGVNFFSMDYVEGRALTELIASSGGLPEAEIIRISGQVLSALAEAHQAGIIHRDIKPDNVIIDNRGDAVVMDFGIAKAATGTRVTAVGSFVGTVHYASPEQARGREIDTRSDLYSWGVVMYEMATGRTPFGGQETSAVVYQHVHEIPDPPQQVRPDLSPGLGAFILKLLEKSPDERFPSAQAALTALERLGGATRAGGTRSHTRIGGGEDELRTEAQSLVDDGLYDDAASVITELIGVATDKHAALEWLEDVQGRAQKARELEEGMQRGMGLEAGGEIDQAAELYEALQQEHGQTPQIDHALERIKAARLAREAGELVRAGDLDAGRDKYQAAVDLRPTDPGIKKQLDEVRTALSRAQRALALLAQAEELSLAGDGRQALDLLEEAAELHAALPGLDEARQRAQHVAERQAPPPAPAAGTRVVAPSDMASARTMVVSPPPEPPAGPKTTPPVAPPPPPLEPPADSAPAPEPQPRPEAQAPPEAKAAKTQDGSFTKFITLAVVGFLALAVGAAGLFWSLKSEPGGQTATPTAAATADVGQQQDQAAEHVRQAQQLLQQGRQDQAAQEFRSALSLDPNNAQALDGLQRIAKQQNKPGDASEASKLVLQGRDLLAQDKLDQAEEFFRKALKADLNNSDAKHAMQVLAKRRQVIENLEQEKRLKQQKHQQAKEKLRQGQQMLTNDQLDQAEAALRQALELDPGLEQAKQELDKVAQRRVTLAEDQRKAQEKAKEDQRRADEEQRKAQIRAKLEQTLKQANDFLRLNELDMAKQAFEYAKTLDPASVEASDGLRAVEARRAAQQEQQQKQTARDETARGRGLLANDQLDQAEDAFKRALAAVQDWPEAKQGLSDVAQRRNELRTKSMTPAKKKERAGKIVDLARTLIKNSHFDRALSVLQEAAKLDPDNEDAQRWIVYTNQRRTEISQGKQPADLEQMRKLSVSEAAKAAKLLRQGDRAEAKRLFAQALEHFPDNTIAQKGLAMASGPAPRPTAKPEVKGPSKDTRLAAQQSYSQGIQQFNKQQYGRAANLFKEYLNVYPNDATARKNLALAEKMATESQFGTLVVNSSPSGDVFLDGRAVGKTPLTIDQVSVGSHQVEIRAYGGASSRSFNISGRTETSVKLELFGGTLQVDALSRAQVWFQNRQVGYTPIVFNNMPLGPREVELRWPGGDTRKYNVTLYKGRTSHIRGTQ